MKKLFIILAVGTMMVSCKWWHETFSSPEKCAQWYLDEILEAAKDGDAAECIELRNDAKAWYKGLSKKDKERVDKATDAWKALHRDEVEKYDF